MGQNNRLKYFYLLMPSDLIREKIRAKLKEKNLSIRKAERMSGLGPTALRYFLSGRTQNPKIETLSAFARVLDVDISELIGKSGKETVDKSKVKWKPNLFVDIACLLKEFLKKETFNLNNSEAISAFLELYYMHCDRETEDLDKELIELFFKKSFKKVTEEKLKE